MTDKSASQIASAINNLAKTIDRAIDKSIESFGHELCMGIRHGLFGTGSERSIESLGEGLAHAINRLTDKLDEEEDDTEPPC